MNNNELIIINKNQTISKTDTFTEERYRLFSCHIGQSVNKVLDFGCNTGRGGIILKQKNDNILLIGADIVQERLQKIPAHIYDQIIDLSKNNIEDQVDNVDAIVAGEVIEHIPFLQFIDYMESFKKTLNKGGMILLTTPNPNSFLVKIGRKSVLNDPSHVNIMDKHFLKSLLSKIGFGDIKIYGSGKATKIFGEKFPLFNVYGSYLIIGKNNKI
jgi:2-polyprenyl-3-methyl-5-hydroxy-6-metoxy-1,4-benzoquinol methylase